jgi:hypothetical protein
VEAVALAESARPAARSRDFGVPIKALDGILRELALIVGVLVPVILQPFGYVSDQVVISLILSPGWDKTGQGGQQ